MSRPEAILQKAVADYLRVALRSPTIWTAIAHGVPLGDKRSSAIRGRQLKNLGLQKGWPDILVMHPAETGGPIVLGIELKSKKGALQPEQRDLMQAFFGVGARYIICRSISNVEQALRFCDVPVRATGEWRLS